MMPSLILPLPNLCRRRQRWLSKLPKWKERTRAMIKTSPMIQRAMSRARERTRKARVRRTSRHWNRCSLPLCIRHLWTHWVWVSQRMMRTWTSWFHPALWCEITVSLRRSVLLSVARASLTRSRDLRFLRWWEILQLWILQCSTTMFAARIRRFLLRQLLDKSSGHLRFWKTSWCCRSNLLISAMYPVVGWSTLVSWMLTTV